MSLDVDFVKFIVCHFSFMIINHKFLVWLLLIKFSVFLFIYAFMYIEVYSLKSSIIQRHLTQYKSDLWKNCLKYPRIVRWNSIECQQWYSNREVKNTEKRPEREKHLYSTCIKIWIWRKDSFTLFEKVEIFGISSNKTHTPDVFQRKRSYFSGNTVVCMTCYSLSNSVLSACTACLLFYKLFIFCQSSMTSAQHAQ